MKEKSKRKDEEQERENEDRVVYDDFGTPRAYRGRIIGTEEGFLVFERREGIVRINLTRILKIEQRSAKGGVHENNRSLDNDG